MLFILKYSVKNKSCVVTVIEKIKQNVLVFVQKLIMII